MNFIPNVFAHLKPKVKRSGKRWLVIRGKYGSKRVSKRCATFEEAVSEAEKIFCSRIVGRAFRYEAARRKGLIA